MIYSDRARTCTQVPPCTEERSLCLHLPDATLSGIHVFSEASDSGRIRSSTQQQQQNPPVRPLFAKPLIPRKMGRTVCPVPGNLPVPRQAIPPAPTNRGQSSPSYKQTPETTFARLPEIEVTLPPTTSTLHLSQSSPSSSSFSITSTITPTPNHSKCPDHPTTTLAPPLSHTRPPLPHLARPTIRPLLHPAQPTPHLAQPTPPWPPLNARPPPTSKSPTTTMTYPRPRSPSRRETRGPPTPDQAPSSITILMTTLARTMSSTCLRTRRESLGRTGNIMGICSRRLSVCSITKELQPLGNRCCWRGSLATKQVNCLSLFCMAVDSRYGRTAVPAFPRGYAYIDSLPFFHIAWLPLTPSSTTLTPSASTMSATRRLATSLPLLPASSLPFSTPAPFMPRASSLVLLARMTCP